MENGKWRTLNGKWRIENAKPKLGARQRVKCQRTPANDTLSDNAAYFEAPRNCE